MRSRKAAMFSVISLGIAASPAWACERDAPTARLLGYSDDQAEERAHQLWSDWRVISHHKRTQKLLDDAQRAYLARVVKSVKNDTTDETRATIEPLSTIKGTLPKQPPVLQGFPPDSCDNAVGNGDGAYAPEGELIIVFEGLSTDDYYRRHGLDRPNGIDSVRVNEVRNIELLDKVQAWLNEQPGYSPWD